MKLSLIPPMPATFLIQRCVISLAATIAMLMVAGCDGARLVRDDDTRPTDVAKLHPVSAEVHWASMDVMSTGGAGLGSTDYLAVTRFVREFRRDGRSPLEIEVPRGARHGRAVESVRYIAEANGVHPRRIQFNDRRDGHSGITLKYERIAAIAPTCGDWSEDAIKRPEIGPYRNFGCASQRNLANMVANPTDLLFPEVEADRHSDHRGKSYRSYTNGTLGAGQAAGSGSVFGR